jgi:hypothetical protein
VHLARYSVVAGLAIAVSQAMLKCQLLAENEPAPADVDYWGGCVRWLALLRYQLAVADPPLLINQNQFLVDQKLIAAAVTTKRRTRNPASVVPLVSLWFTRSTQLNVIEETV